MNVFFFFTETKITILTDANAEKYFGEMDIVVSITSKAIYESQCLQFNFDRVRRYVQPNAILIPNQSTISIVPITSALTHSMLQEGFSYDRRNPSHGLQNYKVRTQTVCPLYTRNFYECATVQELFSFKHHCSCNDRSVRIMDDARIKRSEFVIDRDAVVTGFAGYFQVVLYKDVTLTNRNIFKSHSVGCVPMAYFPLKSPQTLSAKEKLKTVFWLHTDAEQRKCYYEWHTTHPIATPLQNLKGDAFTLHYS